MKSWLILIAAAFASWYFTDVTSSSPMQALVAPLLLTAIIIIAVCKIMAALFTKDGRKSTTGDGGGVNFGGNGSHDSGGDGGGDGGD